MKNLKLLLLLIITTILLVGCESIENKEKTLSNEKWIEDINYLNDKLPQEHPNLFKYLSKEQWKEEIESIKSEVKKLSDTEISLRIAQIIASIQDAHTTTEVLNLLKPIGVENITYDDVVTYPIGFEYFDGGLRVVYCDEEYKSLLGYKLISINNVKAEEIINKISTIISNDYNNKQISKEKAKYILSAYEILKYFDIVEKEEAEYVLEDSNNKNSVINLKAISNKDIKYTGADIKPPKTYEKPLEQSNLYWYKYFEEDNTFFLKINNFYVSKQPDLTEEQKKNLPEIYDLQRMIVENIKETNPKKIVIDARNNAGGYMACVDVFTSIFKDFIDTENIEVFVLTGKRTFSAGVIFAYQMQKEIGATVIGEETGSNVDTFSSTGEYLELPNSKLTILYSNSEITGIDKSYTGGVKPDIEIKQSYKSYINGIDDCYEYIRKSR